MIKHHRVRALCDALPPGTQESFLLDGLYAPPLYGEGMALVVKGAKGFETTPAFDAVVDYVKRCPDVVCVVLDPLNLLHSVDLESDPAAAQFFAGRMAFLARETNTFVLVAHHSTKGPTALDKFDLESALHVNTTRGTGAIMGGFRAVLTLTTLPEKFAKGKFGLAERPAPGEYIAARISKNNYGPLGKPFFLRKDMETGMLYPVRPATQKVESVEKTLVLSRFIPLIVKEVAEQEAQGKRFTKATFAAIYNKTWKSAGDEEASQATLRAAVERALVDGVLSTEMRPNNSGREVPFLTVKGASPLPESGPLHTPNSGLNEGEV